MALTKPISTTLMTAPEGEPVKAKTLKQFLSITHDETPVMIKIGDTYHNIREVRQVADHAVSSSVIKVLVPVDIVLATK